MKIDKFGLLLAAALVPASAHGQDYFGGASLSGIYSSSSASIEDEIIDSSALVGRGYGGLRWDKKSGSTRLQGSSTYYNYFDRKDRWSNAVEAEQQFKLSETVRVGLEGAAATNVSTLEARSADQIAGAARMIYEPGDHRLTLTAALRRRHYDGSSARSRSPLLEADYRYRLGRYQYLDLEARHEQVNSSGGSLDYRRFSLAGYYTHPIGDDSRVRVGVATRRWTWEDRRLLSGERERNRVLVPQTRLTHSLSDSFDAELDYRYIVRRSNDDALDRKGHRLAAALRVQF